MRRLPIYFLVDVSESMVGTPIEEVQNGMRTIIQNLRVDPYALETAFVSILAFAGKATVLSPLTELYKFYPPVFPIGGGTSLGAGLDLLMNCIDRDIQPTTMETKGDWKPIVFLFTDGVPTDNCNAAITRWNRSYRKRCNLVAVSLGDDADALTLAQLTENVLILRRTDAESFSQFFKWVTASIKTSSMAVSEENSDELKLPSAQGINLEKADLSGGYVVDENYVVLHGRCQTTKKDYLIKYAKRLDALGIERMENPHDRKFKLIGAYPIDREEYERLSLNAENRINTMEMVGVPTCPCCGNQVGAVVCECGKLFCVGEQPKVTCPWCGMEGQIGECSAEGMDISRGIG